MAPEERCNLAAADSVAPYVGIDHTLQRVDRWPHALRPFYWLLERLPPTREGARRLGLVTLEQMTRALVLAVESTPPTTTPHILEVPEIRRAGASA